MINLSNVACCKADLVAVGRIARRCGLCQSALGQLALKGILQWSAGISAAGKAHCLMYVCSSGEGIADAAANAGSRAAEGLNLGGVVMGLVFKHKEPVLIHAVNLGVYADGAGVYLFALVQLRQHSPLFEGLCAYGGDIHKGLGALCGLFFAVYLYPGVKVALVCGLDSLILNGNAVQMGGEGGVTAMVGPVGVNQTNLGDGGIAALGIPEIALQEAQVVYVHSKAKIAEKLSKAAVIKGGKPINGHDGIRLCIVHVKGLGLVQ